MAQILRETGTKLADMEMVLSATFAPNQPKPSPRKRERSNNGQSGTEEKRHKTEEEEVRWNFESILHLGGAFDTVTREFAGDLIARRIDNWGPNVTLPGLNNGAPLKLPKSRNPGRGLQGLR